MSDWTATIAAIVTVVSCLLVAPTDLPADESADQLEGTYEALRTDEAARKRIDREVEAVIQQMAFYKRPFARSQLTEATEPCSDIVIDVDGDEISITCDDRKPAVSKKDGTATKWTNGEGETYTLSQEVKSDRVVQTFESDNGTRTNTYILKDDDRMTLDVEIDGEQLPEPITYQRPFRKKTD